MANDLPEENQNETAEAAETTEAPAAEKTETEETPVAEETPAVEEAPEAEEAATEEASSDTEESVAAGLTLGEGAPAASQESDEPAVEPVVRGKLDKFGVAMGTGRRKTSVARVRIKSGDGAISINGRTLEEFFSTDRDRQMIQAPLKATDSFGKVDVWVRVNGGGTTGQTGAVVLGIARALEAMDASNHHALADGGYLTRDGRMVERKKYGYKKARKSFQFSKR